MKRKLTGHTVDSELVSIAEETDTTIQDFFWEFVRIAKSKPYKTCPLFYLTQQVAIREWDKPEEKLEEFIREKLNDGLYGRGKDNSFCVRAWDGTWWNLQSAYRLTTKLQPQQFDYFKLGATIRPQVQISHSDFSPV